MTTVDDLAQKKFDEEDKQWNGPRLIMLGAVVLLVCLSIIYGMSTTQGCSLQIVP